MTLTQFLINQNAPTELKLHPTAGVGDIVYAYIKHKGFEELKSGNCGCVRSHKRLNQHTPEYIRKNIKSFSYDLYESSFKWVQHKHKYSVFFIRIAKGWHQEAAKQLVLWACEEKDKLTQAAEEFHNARLQSKSS